MSIFKDFFVKQKPVFTGITRGIGGFGFGSGGGESAEESFSASGGDVEYTYNGKRIHVFTTSGPTTFVVTETLVNAEVFVVGGGGGAGDNNSGHSSGGGGAGGVATGPAPAGTFTPGTYPITVGPGGAGGPGSTPEAGGSDGSDSIIGAAGGLSATIYGKGGGGTNAAGNQTSGEIPSTDVSVMETLVFLGRAYLKDFTQEEIIDSISHRQNTDGSIPREKLLLHTREILQQQQQ